MSDAERDKAGSSRDEGQAVPVIDLDDDTDAGDSEFEPPTGVQDDDSIAADEDLADEEEVNKLMRVSFGCEGLHFKSSSIVMQNFF